MKRMMIVPMVMVMVLGLMPVVWGERVTIMDDSGRMRSYEVRKDSDGGANIWNMETGKLYKSRRSGSSRYYLDMDTGKSFWLRSDNPAGGLDTIVIPGLE